MTKPREKTREELQAEIEDMCIRDSFSIIAKQWLVRFIKMKRKSDLVLTVLFFVISILAFVGFVSHLLEVRI